MAKLGIHEIRGAAKLILAQHPEGVRFAELVRRVVALHPETNENTVFTQVGNLHKDCPSEVVKPSRGLFQLASTAMAVTAPGPLVPPVTIPVGPERLLESQFYESFSRWLKNELDEVTHVAPLGGAGLKGKWGTPDVIGVYKPSARDVVKFPLEIVSAEVKTDPQQPVVAFGQAVAYRLFSHRVYIAMPGTMSDEDNNRLETLCMLFGVGLAFFDLDKSDPKYTIRVRAQTHQPDAFYVNQFAVRLHTHDPETFERLFG